MRTAIDTRRMYEVYVKQLLKQKYTMTNKTRSAMLKLTLKCFDDGVRFNLGKLEVET